MGALAGADALVIVTDWHEYRHPDFGQIKAALKTNQGRVDAAARALGISRKGLYLKRQRLGL